ncbi:MAG: hypothetical protein V3V41_02470 [Candidatus Heimdallarchaeota archaeon]
MIELQSMDYEFLDEIAFHIENGENLERALFHIENIPLEITIRLQLGEELIDVLSSLEFSNPSILNLFASLSFADSSEVLENVKITSKLMRMREETLREKENTIKIHQRRLGIIRFVTMITIAIMGGFSPLFTNLYAFINTGEFLSSFSIVSALSISFLLINLLNNYFLLKMGNESKLVIRLVVVIMIHIIIVIIVRISFSNFSIFN